MREQTSIWPLTGDAWATYGGDDKRYRYTLGRIFGDGGRLLFIGLNPSTATEHVLDPTIRRVIGFAREWGFGSVEVCNLFAYRSTDPAALLKLGADAIGPENIDAIYASAQKADRVLVGWGAWMGRRRFKMGDPIPKTFAALRGAGHPVVHIGLNSNGSPKHPLYVAGSTEPQPFDLPLVAGVDL